MKSQNLLTINSRPSALIVAVLILCALNFSVRAFSQRPDHALYRFQGGNDGSGPRGNLIADSSGNLYGTTFSGGFNGEGTLYRISPVTGGARTETVLFNFSFAFGIGPSAGLVMDQSGNLYGTTWLGGPNGGGDIFEVSPPAVSGGTWTGTVLYDFSAPNDGYSPETGLAFDKDGNLYGTTSSGGNNVNECNGGCGTVVRLAAPKVVDSDWTETVLYDFPGGTGETGVGGTLSGVTVGPDGSVYGTTLVNPGKNKGQYGNVFRLIPKNQKRDTYKFSLLYKFGFAPDGYAPAGGVILDQQGNVYGTTASGGSHGAGTVFQLTYAGDPEGPRNETILYSFTGGADGGEPKADLTIDGSGNLYGTTAMGGDFNCNSEGCGTVFKLSPPSGQDDAWIETTLHRFTGGNDGIFPAGSVIFGLNDALYGATGLGGSQACGGYGCGTVFSLVP